MARLETAELHRSRLLHNDYTIGWVCALPNELAAARSMLDEVHADLPQNARDNNYYALGRIGKHNIVIACLPEGMPGSVSAAMVAARMLSSFPALRVGLLVGIGGGAPNANVDIRLGDVVVSMPQEVSGGVIQYDFGKTISEGRFHRTGFLNSPPSVLLNAVAILKAKHEVQGPQLLKHVTEASIKYPRLRNTFAFPGTQHDLLFEAEYRHVEGDSRCVSCDPQALVPREPREDSGPTIHHGLIASGNQIIKDALTRDRLSRELNVICFEMEAAGLMNDFPCIVIRGISDYADSHKNKRWQGYAAMTAAAYAKELICVIPERSIEGNTMVADVLDLDLSAVEPSNMAVETSDTSSQGSATLMGDLEPDIIDAAVEKFAQVLASDRRLRPLCATAVLRMTPSVFQRNLITILMNFSKAMQKVARTPLERATTWMLRRRRFPIAIRIYELACRSRGIAETQKLHLDQIPSAQQEQLMRFINDRFPVAQPTFTEQERLQADDADDEEQEDLEEDDFVPPESETLADLKHLDQILCAGAAYWEAYEGLKGALFPSASHLIKKVLNRHVSPKTQPISINCIIEWQFLEYLDSEGITADDVESIFTLTGELDCACAVRLGDYIREVWKTGGELLDAIKTLVDCFSSGSKSLQQGQCSHFPQP
jgi:nucleoside phosphorylase